MKILVTGGAGYLGSVLIPKLLVRGHTVRVLDVGYFGLGHLHAMRPAVEIIRDDIRRVQEDKTFRQELVANCDCIIHLAAISNDPSADLNPELTQEVNLSATMVLAEEAKRQGCQFIFSSSCSVYGEAQGEITENGYLNPLTVYAVSKVEAERQLLELSDRTWQPTCLRNGTLFGYSPRMRFDLVVNIFSLYSTLYNEVKIFGDGKQWRPFLHVDDCARAFVHFAEQETSEHFIYNVAHENLQVVDIAQKFCAINPNLKIEYVALPDQDHRDYRVSNSRMHKAGFHTRLDVMTGAEMLVEAIVNGAVPDPESIFYRNAKWLKELTQLGSKNHRDVVGFMEMFKHTRVLQHA